MVFFIFGLTESGNHSAAAGRLITFDSWEVVFDSQLSVAPVVPVRPRRGVIILLCHFTDIFMCGKTWSQRNCIQRQYSYYGCCVGDDILNVIHSGCLVVPHGRLGCCGRPPSRRVCDTQHSFFFYSGGGV